MKTSNATPIIILAIIATSFLGYIFRPSPEIKTEYVTVSITEIERECETQGGKIKYEAVYSIQANEYYVSGWKCIKPAEIINSSN